MSTGNPSFDACVVIFRIYKNSSELFASPSMARGEEFTATLRIKKIFGGYHSLHIFFVVHGAYTVYPQLLPAEEAKVQRSEAIFLQGLLNLSSITVLLLLP